MGIQERRSNFHAFAEEPATLYVAENVTLRALKIGVTSTASRSNRIHTNERHGWRTAVCLPFTDGHGALQAERALLEFVRSCGATQLVNKAEMPQGGYTETLAFADVAGIDVDQLADLARIAFNMVAATNKLPYALKQREREIKAIVQEFLDVGQKQKAREFLEEISRLLERAMAAL
ncbi:hypothetical protein [Streptomyces sp. NBC_00658]|uniref:hypothetical protein n=1 Tax=Streptomyces sp. NBC_00658 TaxID=2975800 RepID=UPI00324B6D8C